MALKCINMLICVWLLLFFPVRQRRRPERAEKARGSWNTAQSHPRQRTKKKQIFLDRLCQAASLLKKCMPQSQSTEIAFSLYMWYFLWGKNLTIAMRSEKPSPRNTHNWNNSLFSWPNIKKNLSNHWIGNKGSLSGQIISAVDKYSFYSL